MMEEIDADICVWCGEVIIQKEAEGSKTGHVQSFGTSSGSTIALIPMKRRGRLLWVHKKSGEVLCERNDGKKTAAYPNRK